MSAQNVVAIGANCVVRIRNMFFLVVEIEVDAINLSEFVFIQISRREASILLAAGVKRCQISNRIPTGNAVLTCVLIVAGEAFAVFDVEDTTDEAVLVRISLREAERLIRRGVRRCTVISR